MAASGKKGKKNKGKTISLTSFLSDGPGPANAPPSAPRKSSSWADDVEDEDIYEMARKEKVFLPTAPRSTRMPEINENDVPLSPPFLAYISNLPYDGTEDEISNFFKGMKISNVRLPRDDRQPGKLKGFGYVEFEDRASLFAALNMSDQHINGRRIRIEIADNSDTDRGRGGRGRMERRDRTDGPSGPDRTLGDWRSGPRGEPPPEPEKDRGYGGFDRRGMGSGTSGNRRDFGSGGFRNSDRDGGGFRNDHDGNFRNSDRERDGGFRNMDRERDGNFRNTERDRDGGFRNSDRERDGGFRNFDRDRDGGFRDSEGYGRYNRDRDSFNRDRDRDSRGDRDFNFRASSGPRRSEYDKDSFTRGREDAPASDKNEPKERPRLNLKPRTKDAEVKEEPATQSSIFGGAKPVDTAAREKEIEERLAREKEATDLPRAPASRLDDSRPRKEEEKEKEIPPKFEPAPIPKENVWARQPPHNNSHDECGTSPPSSDHESDRNRQQHKEENKKQHLPSRPRNDSGEQRRNPSKDNRVGGGGGGTVRNKGHTSPVGEKQPKVKDTKHGSTEELSRMPKYKEQEIPNFAGDNKFAYLSDDSDRE